MQPEDSNQTGEKEMKNCRKIRIGRRRSKEHAAGKHTTKHLEKQP